MMITVFRARVPVVKSVLVSPTYAGPLNITQVCQMPRGGHIDTYVFPFFQEKKYLGDSLPKGYIRV